jgi:chorismate-pyruvate lyase
LNSYPDTSLPRLTAGQVTVRRELVAEFQQLVIHSDNVTGMLTGWLDAPITVHVDRHIEQYEPTYQERRQLMHYNPASCCWKRVSRLATAGGTPISHATNILIPERLTEHQAAAVREGTVPLGEIWSPAAMKRHIIDQRCLRDSVLCNLDDPWLEVTVRVTVIGIPVALITEEYYENLLYTHRRWTQ